MPSVNYRHAYHAGNFADVVKHSFLLLLIEHLLKKDKPFCYLETHSGSGRYRLPEATAERVPEYVDGIERLLHARHLQGALLRYFRLIKGFNDSGEMIPRLRMYPGSPLIAAQLLRAQDRMLLCELHADEAESLQALFRGDSRAHVQARDGYQAISALLPPTPRRGLVLIDPPFERPDEFSAIILALKTALQRWPLGIYAVWYPIKRRTDVQPFLRAASKLVCEEIISAELSVHPDDTNLRLNGCGMLILNPPYGFAQPAQELLQDLNKLLSQSRFGRAELLSIRG